MEVGYLPDMFGHVAQMPQILRQFGFADAVVWRGVPSASTGARSGGAAPDGSTVRAEYLPTGYGNGSALPDDAKALIVAIADWIDEHRALLGARRPDPLDERHRPPDAPGRGSAGWSAEANAINDDLQLVVTSLAEHLARREPTTVCRRSTASCAPARAPTS